MFEISYLLILLIFGTLAIIWKVFLSFFLDYLIAVYHFGFKHIAIVYKPLSTYNTVYKQSIEKHKHCFGFVHDKIKRNPHIKIIFLRVFGITHLSICDPELLKQISFSYSANLQKRQLLIFFDELSKGLLFSEGNYWKQSRKTLSNIFHFDALLSREQMMKNVIDEKLDKLNNTTPKLLKLGCSISGEIVIKSLFGERFYGIRFNGKTPFEEINQLMNSLIITSRKLPNIIRSLFNIKATKESKLLTSQQKACLKRLLQFKRICKCFLEEEYDIYKRGSAVTGFLEVYFKQHQLNNLEEIIQQLYIFLIAGEDTTGGLISYCILYLALYPQYQKTLHNDIAKSGIYNSKQLSNFISEANRFNTPVQNSLSRIVTQPFQIDGYKFKRNTVLTFGFSTIMRNLKFWDNPNEFNPDRFNHPIEHPTAYTPFSSGPRNCIGQHMALMEVKLTLAKIIEKYELEIVDKDVVIINTGSISVNKNQQSVYFRAKKLEKVTE